MLVLYAVAVTALFAAEPEVLWSAVTSGGVYCSAEMGDLDGDSVPDVACGVNFWDGEPTLWLSQAPTAEPSGPAAATRAFTPTRDSCGSPMWMAMACGRS